MVELPDDAIEAAACAISGYSPVQYERWRNTSKGQQHHDRAVAALTAAYPLIAARVRAEALREAAEKIAPNQVRPSNVIIVGARMSEDVLSMVRTVEDALVAAVRAEAVAAERQRIKATVWTQRGLLADREHTLAVVNRIIDAAGSVPVATPQRPEIVVLCGSTRFKDAFRGAAKAEALAGRIVLTVSDLDPRPEARHVNVPIDAETKARLDELHRRKIDLADQVLVLNVGGYIGESTRSEIEYATALGKPISYLEAGPRPQPGRVGFGTDAFEVGGSLPGQPVATPTEPPHMHNWDGPCPACASVTPAEPAAEPDLLTALQRSLDEARRPVAASPVPAEQPPTCKRHGRAFPHVYGLDDDPGNYGYCDPAGFVAAEQPEER